MARVWRVVRRACAWCAAGGWRRALLLCAALGSLAALAPRAPARALLDRRLARSPQDLAHYLADFSNHLHTYPNLDSWTIEEEWSNYSSWQYEVAYTCGARCWGRTAVSAHAAPAAGGAGEGAPRHGPARRHRLVERDQRCRQLPLLPWPSLCEVTESETLIEEWQGGARLQESARAWCGALTSLLGRCATDAQLRVMRALRVAALPSAPAAPAAPAAR